MFTNVAKWLSKNLGDSKTFTWALILVLIWLALGPVFNFSDTWELVINTVTTIITFLMVFLLQNTQNRDTTAIHLKLDEIIRAMGNTHNELLKVEELSDEELERILKKYEALADVLRDKTKQGKSISGIPDIDTGI